MSKYKSRNDHGYLETVKSLPTLKRKIEYTLSYHGLLIVGIIAGIIIIISMSVSIYRNSAPVYLRGDYLNVYALDDLGALNNTYLEDTFLHDYLGLDEKDRTRILYNSGYSVDIEEMEGTGAVSSYETVQILAAHMATQDVDYYLLTEKAVDYMYACDALMDMRDFLTEEEMELYADRLVYTIEGIPVGVDVSDSHIIKNMGLSAADPIYLAWFTNSAQPEHFRPFFDYVMNYTAE